MIVIGKRARIRVTNIISFHKMLAQSVFRSSRALSRWSVLPCVRVKNFGTSSTTLAPAEVEKVAVIGSGLMGSGIAQVRLRSADC